MGAAYNLVIRDALELYQVGGWDVTLKELWVALRAMELEDDELFRISLSKNTEGKTHFAFKDNQTVAEIAALIRQFANNDYRNCDHCTCSLD